MNFDNPVLLSVIIPAYNSMPTLERCVNSVRKQTVTNIEILIVDDGSTDNTGALAEKLAMMDKRIRVFHKENGGSSSARNMGIENAVGEFLGFVDSDDYIEPQMYERMLGIAFSEKLSMVQISRDELDSELNRKEDVCIPPSQAGLYDDLYLMGELLMHRGDCSFCTRITHRDLFKDMKFPEGELNEDFNLLVRMLPVVKKVAILPEQEYHVIYSKESNTRSENKNNFSRVFRDIVVNADRVDVIVKEKYPSLMEKSFRFGMYQRLDYMLHIPVMLMSGKDEFYKSVRRYLRRNKWKALFNKHLTKKNKQYIFILGTCPKLARKIHQIKMKGNK